ncbi:hypothetical protein Tco_1565802, partial [Tanacetum coccineum]
WLHAFPVLLKYEQRLVLCSGLVDESGSGCLRFSPWSVSGSGGDVSGGSVVVVVGVFRVSVAIVDGVLGLAV